MTSSFDAYHDQVEHFKPHPIQPAESRRIEKLEAKAIAMETMVSQIYERVETLEEQLKLIQPLLFFCSIAKRVMALIKKWWLLIGGGGFVIFVLKNLHHILDCFRQLVSYISTGH